RLGETATELGGDRQRADRRPGGEVAGSEAVERPGGNLLQAQDVRVVGGREPDHLVEEGHPLRRDAVAVKEVPAPDQHATTLLRCVSCLRIRRRSRPGTTT